MRHPYNEADIGVNIAGTRNFERFVQEGSGSFISVSVREAIARHYVFTAVGDLPLVLNVGLSVDEIEAEWRSKAWVISLIVLMLCGLTTSLALLFGRELRRRTAIQAELARLSQTDTLTGLANRREFETASTRAWKSALRSGKPVSLLVVDADHFKRYNDRYGHAVGDEVLKALAHSLSASVHRPNDIVCRVGGEEFVLLLPDTDQAGALRVAERVHAEVSSLTVGTAGIAAGSVTVSVGVASAVPNAQEATTVMDLYRRADAALYEAKAGGRNQTRRAASDSDITTDRQQKTFYRVETP